MTRDPFTIKPNSPVAFALSLMSEGGFRHVPIVDEDGMPISTLSVRDIVDYVVAKVSDDLDSLETVES